MQKLGLVLLVTLLLGCVQKVHEVKNVPFFRQLAFEVVKNGNKNILLVSQEKNSYHFIYMSSLGVPIVKKSLENGVFKTDGFYKPNKKSEVLFIKILDFIKSKRKKDKISLENGDIYEVREIDVSK